MATLQATTTSTGAIVSDPQAIRELCENHCFGTLNWEVTEEDELIIWGYDDFEVYEARENGLPDYEGGIVTHEFLREVADQLEANEELDIQMVGFTKCPFPVLAKRYVVRGGNRGVRSATRRVGNGLTSSPPSFGGFAAFGEDGDSHAPVALGWDGLRFMNESFLLGDRTHHGTASIGCLKNAQRF